MTQNFELNNPEDVEEWLSLDFESFHESWQNSWGTTIESEELRELILSVPRLSSKLQDQVIISASSEIIGDRSNDAKPFSTQDAELIKSYISLCKNKGFLRKVGLAWNANVIKYHLNGPGSHELIDELGQSAIRTALQYQHVAPYIKEVPDINQLKKRIDGDGLECLLCWVMQFPNNVAVRLAVLLPRPNTKIDENRPEAQTMLSLVDEVVISSDKKR